MPSLAEKLRAQRQHWVEVAPGKRVRYLRPRETELATLAKGVKPDHVCQYVDGWEGFTEADLLGPAIGASDVVPFDEEVWAEYVRDRVDVLGKVAQAIADTVMAYIEQRGHGRKKLTALLDAHGVDWEGEERPQASHADTVAFRVARLLANGMGGLDWDGLGLVCDWLGINDIDGLLLRLEVIKAHKPPDDNKD